jgi:cytochrome c oxidase cbb3-type subunit 3
MNNPNTPRDPLLLDHEADGIQELDNNLPRWWVWLFYLCTLFALVYMVYYHVLGQGQLQAAAYATEKANGDAIKKAAVDRFDATVGSVTPSQEEASVDRGRELFITYCSPCHRKDAGGLVGPNLCDDYWIHGSQFTDTVKVIWNGVPEKGMLSWREQGMQPSDILAVASYIYTLRGSNPPNPKPREDQAPATPTEVYE